MTRIERAGLAVGLILAAALMVPLHHFATDGTYVWLRYAQNLANGHGLVFNAGERVYGCTSPLWVALIADGMALGFDGLAVARVIGFVATLASVGLFLQLLRRTIRSPVVRAVATVAWSANPWMMQWASSGLETSLAVALVLAGFVALTEGETWGERPVRTGSLWALVALTRPGAVLLLVLWATLLIADANNRPAIRRLIYGVAPGLLIYGSWLVFARVYYGSFWPQALSLSVEQPVGWSPSLAHLFRQARLAAPAHGVLAAAFAIAMISGGRRMWPSRGSLLVHLPWLWVLALPALFAARLAPIESRQLLLVVPIATWLVWRSVETWWSGDRPTPHAFTRGAILGGLIAGLVLLQEVRHYRNVVAPTVDRESKVLESTALEWGRWLRREAPPRAAIATRWIGAIGYASGLRVVDLTGLVTPGMVPLRDEGKDLVGELAFSDFARPEYLLDRSPDPRVDASRYAGAFAMLREAEGYALRSIDWAVVDSLRARGTAGSGPPPD